MAFWETVLQIVILILALRALHMVSAGHSCSEVRRNFIRQVGPSEMIPYSAREAKDLRICPNFQLSCCSREMEDRFQARSKRDLKQALRMKTSGLKFNFRSFAENYQGDVMDTFMYSRNRTRDVVKKSLRKKVESHRLRASLHEVDHLFQSLELQSTGDDVKRVFDRFADKVFLILMDEENTGSEADLPYERCVAEQRRQLHPFMDVPGVSASNLTTAIQLAHTLHKGLVAGAVAVNVTADVKLSKSCQEALVKMEYCSYCPAFTLLKPCLGLCKNVLRGCFAGVYEMDQYWNYYISALADVAERMRSSESKYNLEVALEDFQNKISSSLSVILENITSLRATVEKQCKNTRSLTRSKRSDFPSEAEADNENNRLGDRSRGRNNERRLLRGDRRRQGRSRTNELQEGLHLALRGLEEVPIESTRVRPPHEWLIDVAPKPTKTMLPQKAGYKIIESQQTSSHLRKRIGRFVSTLNSSINFYRHLADNICGGGTGMDIEVSRESHCWAGSKMVEQYPKEVVPQGYGKQASNPEVKVLNVDKDIKGAIEGLRLTAKNFFAASGKEEIPDILLHAPVFKKREDEKILPENGLPEYPCDDEDDCIEKDEGSGDTKEFDPDSAVVDRENADESLKTDLEITRDLPAKGINEPTVTDDVFREVSVEEEQKEKRENCKGGRKRCGGGRRNKNKDRKDKGRSSSTPTTTVAVSTTSSARSVVNTSAIFWFISILFSRLTFNILIKG